MNPVIQPSVWILPTSRRGWDRWGLLGGSSSGTGNRGKQSKLANLARSSRGAFDKSASTSASTRLSSMSRLATLTSKSQTRPTLPISNRRPSSPPLIPQTDSPALLESTPKQSAPDPIPFHLLSPPSLLADCLYCLSLVPRDAATSAVNIQANPYLLIGSTKAQVRKAFANPSPDDIVQKAQSQSKSTSPSNAFDVSLQQKGFQAVNSGTCVRCAGIHSR